jgi:hypothetical protein
VLIGLDKPSLSAPIGPLTKKSYPSSSTVTSMDKEKKVFN